MRYEYFDVDVSVRKLRIVIERGNSDGSNQPTGDWIDEADATVSLSHIPDIIIFAPTNSSIEMLKTRVIAINTNYPYP